MKSQHISRRRFVGGSVLALGTATLPACGGGSDLDEAELASAEERAYATRAKVSVNGPIKLPSTPTPTPTPAPAPAPGTAITTINVSSSQATTAAFAATVLPLRGPGARRHDPGLP